MNILPNLFWKWQTDEKVVSFTFDDGPDPTNTPKILDILKKNNARATFFVSGSKMILHPLIIQKILAEGHQLANHSFEHKNFLFKSKKWMKNQIEKTDNLIAAAGQRGEACFRPPFARFGLGLLKLLIQKKKILILWNIPTRDYKNVKNEIIYETVLKKAKPGSIVVMHDGGKELSSDMNRENTILALTELLPALAERGFSFVTIDEMFSLKSNRSFR